MNAQAFTKQGQNKPFAICLNVPLKSTENPDSRIFLVPEFGGIMANFEIYDSTELAPPVSIEPCEIGGITAVFCVEVWGCQKGKRKRITERWYFAEDPPDNYSPHEFIVGAYKFRKAETMSHYQKRRAERRQSFFKTEKAMDISPWNNARDATLELLKREYKLLARALAGNQPASETQKAFVADCVRLTGCVDADVNLNDPKFVANLADAWQAHERRNTRKSKVDALDWYLASPRNWLELHALPMEEIARKANAATGFTLSTGAIEKRIERLRLVTPRKRGKPTKA